MNKEQALERVDAIKAFSEANLIEALDALEQAPIIEPFRCIKEATFLLKECLDTPVNSPEHTDIMNLLVPELSKLEEIQESMRERLAEFMVRSSNCECESCKIQKQRNAAANN